MRDPKPGEEPAEPQPLPHSPAGPPPEGPEVRPDADDPVREHTAGDEPVPTAADPRLSIEFF